jgi:transcriptional regulator with XRE-family HTH domain
MGTPSPIRAHRLAQFLNKSELARLAGVSRDTVIRAERGTRVNEISRARLAAALDVDVDVLFPPAERSA